MCPYELFIEAVVAWCNVFLFILFLVLICIIICLFKAYIRQYETWFIHIKRVSSKIKVCSSVQSFLLLRCSWGIVTQRNKWFITNFETLDCTYLISLKGPYYTHVHTSSVTCLHALMFKTVFIFLLLPVLQHLFSPYVWNQSPVCSDWLAGRLCCDWSMA